MDVSGKKALITGGAQRIGKSITERLIEKGAEVAVHYHRSEKEAFDLCDSITKKGGKAFPLCQDLSEEKGALCLFDHLDQKKFIPHILINSASIFNEDTLLDAEYTSFHDNMSINSLAPLFLCREMAKRSSKGVIVNFLDTRINDYDKLHVPYHMSKQLLYSLTRMLCDELAPRFRVNAIAPGSILPPSDLSLEEENKWYERMRENNILKINGTLDQICDTCDFLIKNDFITGQVIYVDGGRHLKGSFYG